MANDLDELLAWAAAGKGDACWVRISAPTKHSDYWRVQLNERDGDTILSVDMGGLTPGVAALHALREWHRAPYRRRH